MIVCHLLDRTSVNHRSSKWIGAFPIYNTTATWMTWLLHILSQLLCNYQITCVASEVDAVQYGRSVPSTRLWLCQFPRLEPLITISLVLQCCNTTFYIIKQLKTSEIFIFYNLWILVASFHLKWFKYVEDFG